MSFRLRRFRAWALSLFSIHYLADCLHDDRQRSGFRSELAPSIVEIDLKGCGLKSAESRKRQIDGASFCYRRLSSMEPSRHVPRTFQPMLGTIPCSRSTLNAWLRHNVKCHVA